MAKLKKNVLARMADTVVRTAEAKERLRAAASAPLEETYALLQTSPAGLGEGEVRARRARFGENALPAQKKRGAALRLLLAFANPFTAILLALALVSACTDIFFAAAGERNYVTVGVILVMVGVSGVLRFVQETKSSAAAEKLAGMVGSTACAVRGGQAEEVPVSSLVPGDVVRLSAGDMIPADLRIVEARDLFISQSALTGESAPEEKSFRPAKEVGSLTGCACLAFMGTNVVSGTGVGIVAATGAETVFGQTARSLGKKPGKTAFERGVASVSHILIAFMLAMVPVVLLLNGFTKGDWLSASLFAVSVAVGLTPEMLPMIVTACLAKGAVSLSRRKVIVKNLNSIQNLGAMDVLCTDKTGTLTLDKVVLEMHLNAEGREDASVLFRACLNSRFQTGLKNLMDVAVIERAQELGERGELSLSALENFRKADELPFDFQRRRMSVAVASGEKCLLVTKGAAEEMLSVCAFAEWQGGVVPLTPALRAEILARIGVLNRQGLRVLAVAQKSIAPDHTLSAADETEMTLAGYLAFLDPPKATAPRAVSRLQKLGISVKVLTGDNETVAACVCRKVGIAGEKILLGSDLENLNDAQLAEAAEEAAVFAKLSPAQKERIVRVLREKGHVVGFMGDGINDAPAMRAADAGISVDTAVDVAKESAGVILLEKDLTVLAAGVEEGRKTHANTMKYIKITASSNFGNMLSVLAASAFLPFLPMLSVQLILLNLVYDLSCTSFPWDNVLPEDVARPAVWEARSIVRFMFCFGPLSSVFDIATYAILYYFVCPAAVGAPYAAASDVQRLQFAALFRTGWFIESIATQSLVIHLLRGRNFPFVGAHASLPVCLATFGGVVCLSVLPFTPAGSAVELLPPPAIWFAVLACILAGYVFLTTLVKKLYIQRFGCLL